MKRDNIFWGSVLILLGVLFLLQRRGIISEVAPYFWSLALLFVGGWLILSVYWRSSGLGEERFSIALGGLLVFGGVVSLLEATGIIPEAGKIFWGILWGAVALYFLYLLMADKARNWWAAFPGFTLAGMVAASFLPSSLEVFDGLVFLGGISLAFLWTFLANTHRWWAIIPAGVLLTLGVVSVLDELSGIDTGGIFLIGLGLTFVLVAILPGGGHRTWAFIPGAALLIIGTLLVPSLGLGAYIGPVVLILLGAYFIFQFFKPQE
jgi:hypothetical protein